MVVLVVIKSFLLSKHVYFYEYLWQHLRVTCTLMLIYKDPPEALEILMEKWKNTPDFLVTPAGSKDKERSVLSHINPQLCLIHGYFSDDHANLRGMTTTTRGDIYQRFENIDLNSLLRLVLTLS